MEALAASFTARADEIDERMRTFAASIAETVSDTERRLSRRARPWNRPSTSTSSAVTEGLQHLLDCRRPGEPPRQPGSSSDAQQAMLSEMQSTLDEATRRFNDTAAAMRATAGQVGQELEATRVRTAARRARTARGNPRQRRRHASRRRRTDRGAQRTQRHRPLSVRHARRQRPAQARRDEPAPAPRYPAAAACPQPPHARPRIPIRRAARLSRRVATTCARSKPASRSRRVHPVAGLPPPTSLRRSKTSWRHHRARSVAPAAPVRERARPGAIRTGWRLAARRVAQCLGQPGQARPAPASFTGLSGEIARAIEPSALAKPGSATRPASPTSSRAASTP